MRARRLVTVSPVTRGSGQLTIQVVVSEGRVVSAGVMGGVYRGFERIMVGRDPYDAPYLTEKICGICSTAHGAAASLMLEAIYGVEVPENGRLMRNLMLGAEYLQNHLRHFYLFELPDFVPGHPASFFYNPQSRDNRFSPQVNERLLQHYHEAVSVSILCHEMLALLGGKVPHSHGMVPGGTTVGPRADILTKLASLLKQVCDFIDTRLLPDTHLLAEIYPDYFEIGEGPGNFMSYGVFADGIKNNVFSQGVIIRGEKQELCLEKITESLRYTWLNEDKPAPYKEGAYTWVEGVRYQGEPVEVGPLARAVIGGEQCKSSAMDRIIARSREAYRISRLMSEWLDQIEAGKPVYYQPKGIVNEEASGIVEAPRGSLLHRAKVVADRIVEYKIITPSEWNFSPRDDKGKLGVVEHSLVSTPIEDPDIPIEVGRVVRSFDPCLYCATHVIKV